MNNEIDELRGMLSAVYEALLAALVTDGGEKQYWIEQALWESCGRDDNAVRSLYRVPAPGSRPLSFTARELLRCLLNQAFRDGYLDPDEIEPSTEELMRLVDARPQMGQEGE